jgi:hypothetical protein
VEEDRSMDRFELTPDVPETPEQEPDRLEEAEESWPPPPPPPDEAEADDAEADGAGAE